MHVSQSYLQKIDKYNQNVVLGFKNIHDPTKMNPQGYYLPFEEPQ
jgi:hypothetical protein